MPVINRIAALHDEMTTWRRDIHAHPETGFEEVRTADIVATLLASFGIEVHRGLRKTGVVGTLRAGTSGRAIGLRADMDALPIEEANTFDHRSTHEGRMHACGHDGHTAILLGAAKYLAETRNFDGTVHFVFQPAEEGQGGAKRMIDEGLFRKFPMDAIYGLHNLPGLDAGKFSVRPGAMMASGVIFEIRVTGKGTHGGLPHNGYDPIVCAAQIITALQTLVSRETNPEDQAVVSVGSIHAGDAFNVIPDTCAIKGSTRAFSSKVDAALESSMRRIAHGVATAMRCTAEVSYERIYPVLVNDPRHVEIAAEAMCDVVGASNVMTDGIKIMAMEDFAFMLEAVPGAYVFLGNGDTATAHNPHFDFKDEALPIGASFFARLVERTLARAA
jgi:hippurate hydrolase